MRLSRHFSLAEFLVTSHTDIDNTPTPAVIQHLQVCAEIMELVRAACGGKPVVITNGYRCPRLNKRVGGVDTSAHLTGYAADFRIPGLTPHEIVRRVVQAGIWFDQIIAEYRGDDAWVHMSADPKRRMQVLTYNNGTYHNLEV